MSIQHHVAPPPSRCIRAIDPAMSNGEAWAAGRVLQVGQQLFEVVRNPPTIDKVV